MILVDHKLKISEKNAMDARENNWNLSYTNESIYKWIPNIDWGPLEGP